MSKKTLTTAIILTLTMILNVGCAESMILAASSESAKKENKLAEENTKEANRNIEAMNAIQLELNEIELYIRAPEASSFYRLSYRNLKKASILLETYIAYANEAVNRTNKKNVKHPDKGDLELMRKNAQTLKAMVDSKLKNY